MEKYRKKVNEIFSWSDNQCPYYNKCRNGIKYGNKPINEKFLYDRARIGELYGNDNTIPNIVIVGIEGFSDEKIVKDVISPSLDANNSHYNGVKYTLSYLLADFMNKDKPAPKITNSSVDWIQDALKRYCLCNLYKCAFVPEDEPQRTRGLCHSQAMQENCINLLVSEIKALEPDIVVIQAATTKRNFTQSMKNVILNEFNLKEIKSGDDGITCLYNGKIFEKQMLLIQTRHGSDRKFKSHSYIEEILNPILDKAIELINEK